MFITVDQTISENTLREGAPAGYRYDDPWGVAMGIAESLRLQYGAWLENKYPNALIEVDKVKVSNRTGTTEVKVVVFRFGHMDNEIKDTIEPFLNLIHAGFDMAEIDRGHLLATAS